MSASQRTRFDGASETAQELARQIADAIWSTYDDEFGYATEKRATNSSIGARGFHPDNIWAFWGQFDSPNQAKFLRHVVCAQRAGEAGARELADWIFNDQSLGVDGDDLCAAVVHPATLVDPEKVCEVYAEPGSEFCTRHRLAVEALAAQL